MMSRGDIGLCQNEEQKESNNRLIQVDNNILNDEEFEPISSRNNVSRQYESTLINDVREMRVPQSHRDEDLLLFERNNISSE